MNHDIIHCTGVNGDTVCEKCHRKKAHEELLIMVHRDQTESGKHHSYLNAEECKAQGYNMYWGCSGSCHDESDAISSRE